MQVQCTQVSSINIRLYWEKIKECHNKRRRCRRAKSPVHVSTTPSDVCYRHSVTHACMSKAGNPAPQHGRIDPSYGRVVVEEVDVSRSLAIVAHEITVARRS